MADERAKAKASNSSASVSDFAKECGVKWANLSAGDKQKYTDTAAKVRLRFVSFFLLFFFSLLFIIIIFFYFFSLMFFLMFFLSFSLSPPEQDRFRSRQPQVNAV